MASTKHQIEAPVATEDIENTVVHEEAAGAFLARRNAELEAAFPQLVRADSPSQQVGHDIGASPLSKVTHAVRMVSLDNAFTDEEVAEFVARVRRFLAMADDAPLAFTSEDKIDGYRVISMPPTMRTACSELTSPTATRRRCRRSAN